MGALHAYRERTIQNRENVVLLLKASFGSATASGALLIFRSDFDLAQRILFKFSCLACMLSIIYGVMGLLVYSYIARLGRCKLKQFSVVDYDFVLFAQACAFATSFIFLLTLFAV